MPMFSLDGQEAGRFDGQCATVDRAVAAGVTMLVLPNVDRTTSDDILALHTLRPDNTRIALGLHPTEVQENWQTELAYNLRVLRENASACVAVGEVGIDLYWDKTYEREQMLVFEEHLKAAQELGLPVIIHCREGLDHVLEVMQPYPDVAAVFHSFGGTIEDVERIRRQGDYYFGINGIVTFKNSTLAHVLPAIGIERILTETDAPYLAPVPHRGKRNESAWIPCIVSRIAEALAMSFDEVAHITHDNAYKFMNIKYNTKH